MLSRNTKDTKLSWSKPKVYISPGLGSVLPGHDRQMDRGTDRITIANMVSTIALFQRQTVFSTIYFKIAA